MEIFPPRFKKFSQEAFSQRMVGFAFSRAWVYIAFTPVLMIQQYQRTELINMLYILSLATLVILLFSGGIANERCELLLSNQFLRSLPAALSILGTSAIPFLSFDNSTGIIALVIAASATGIGSGLFVLFWGKVYSRVGGPMTAAEASVAFILATLPIPLIVIMPPLVQIIVLTIIPIVSLMVLNKQLDSIAKADRDEEVIVEPSSSNQEDNQKGWHLETIGLGWQQVLFKLVSSSIIFGCVVSLIHSMYSSPFGGRFEIHSSLPLFLSAFLAGGITLIVLLFSKRLDLAFTYRPVLIFMSLGCLLLPFLEQNGIVPWALTMSGYLCFEIMNWVALSDISYRFNFSPYKVFGFGRAAVSGGVLLGSLCMEWLNANVVFSFQIVVGLCFAMVFVMIITYTFTLTERDIARITKQRSPLPHYSQEEPLLFSIDEKALLLAEEHDIRGRSLEVLLLLAKGRTGIRIEQELYMSRGTVNTHMRRLYQKLNIHTRQDLLDLIDAVELPAWTRHS